MNAPDTTIDRLREIARQSRDHMILADGPVHLDADLLDLCAEALHLLHRADEKLKAARAIIYPDWRYERQAWEAAGALRAGLWQEQEALVRQAKPLQSRIRKRRASTAAGVYSKALLVRNTRTGAPLPAKSLAEDLVACPGLRASLWPAGTEGAGP
jgi:hypothetical protein